MPALRVLVADDNPINLRTATTVLKGLGHTGALVIDGQRALRALQAQSFDLVLLDVNMPELDGLGVLAQLRLWEAQGRPRTRVLMVSAYDEPSDWQAFVDAGADGALSKPLRSEALQAELNRLFSPALLASRPMPLA